MNESNKALKARFDQEEREILEAFEKGKLTRVKYCKKEKVQAEQAAGNYFHKYAAGHL